jgi:glycosyltransferase involved in cell wall biosynthesis
LVDLVKHSDPQRVQWTGVAVSGFGGCDPSLAAELHQHTRLYANRLPVSHKGLSPFHKPAIDSWTSPDFREAVALACKGADVVVTWGQPQMRYWFDQLKVPRVICSHTTRREDDWMHHGGITGVTHLVAVSEAAMVYFEGRDGYDRLPKTVIYNGADPGRLKVDVGGVILRDLLGIYPADRVVGYLGRQSPEKNYLAAARAVGALPLNYHAVYYGNGPHGNGFCPDLMTWCEANIPGRYHVHSPVSDVGNVLDMFDVLMLVSHREAFSLTLIEAWLAGVPVIATPVGCLPELEEKYGPLTFRVPLNPSDAVLQKAVKIAINAHGLRGQITGNAKLVAEDHFTVKAMADRWMTYLEDVVARRI